MFYAGFEKIAVSNEWISKRISRGTVARQSGFKLSDKMYKSQLKASKPAISKIYDETLGSLYSGRLTRKMLRSSLSKNRQATRQKSYTNAAPPPNKPSPANTPASVKPKMSLNKKLLIGGTLGAGSIGAYTWAKHKKNKASQAETIEPVSQVENNYHTPVNLQRDPAYSLMG